MNNARLTLLSLALMLLTFGVAQAEDDGPYGSASLNMHEYPEIDAVWDVNYDDPEKFHIFNAFINNTYPEIKGHQVVVTHGPELQVFAKENYERYQPIVDAMAELAAEDNIDFKMCFNAMRAQGYEAEDIHGFIEIVPGGFPEIAYWQHKGYVVINPKAISPGMKF